MLNHEKKNDLTTNANKNETPKSASVWSVPNDRELMIRSKLKTGWSFRTQNQTSSLHINSQIKKNQQNAGISELEFSEIENVLKRAETVEKKELTRITRLYERFEYVNRPHGDGKSSCYLCGQLFGTFTSKPHVCCICAQNCCVTCSADTLCSTKHTKWICKICSEYREFYKKSGAWFHRQIPLKQIKTKKQEINTDQNSSREMSTASSVMHMKKDEESSIDKSSLPVSLNTSLSSLSALSMDYATNLKKKKNKTKKNQSLEDDDGDCEEEMTDEMADAYSDIVEKTDPSDNQKDGVLHSSPKSKTPYQIEPISLSIIGNATQLTPQKQQSDNSQVTSSNNDLESKEVELKKNNNALSTKKISSIFTSPSFKKKTPLPKSLSVRESSSPRLNVNDLGSIRFSVIYNSASQQLKVNIISASNLPPRDSNGLSDPYVKLHLLPCLAKSTKLRSKTVYKNLNPKFNEILTYEAVSIEDLNMKTLRLTVLDEDKLGFDNIGEYRLPLKIIQIDEDNTFDVKLKPIKELGDDLNTDYRGKISFSLKYCKQKRVLYVKINRCVQLLPMDNGKSSDPFVQISLASIAEKHDKYKQKTSIKWKTLDPEFNEEFKFENIELKALIEKVIEISVWDKDIGSNDFIGCVKLGQACSGDELTHFFTMIKNPGIYHEQWHALKDDL